MDWLLANATYRGAGNFVVWEYNYPWPPYNLESGWTGSLNQATIIKALSFAYLYSKDLKYIEMINKSLNAFEVDVKNGGLRITRERRRNRLCLVPRVCKRKSLMY